MNMLTRLKVNGFKNLVNVDIRFGPFTCIAGPNGVGKSNLFDAIRFLSALADDRSLIEAAGSVREGKTTDVRSLFHRVGDQYDDRMSFEAEMIVPSEGEDDLGQKAEASITFLKYSLELVHRKESTQLSLGGLELKREELIHINLSKAKRHLYFPHSKTWRESAIKGRRTAPFISTDGEKIQLHQDFGGTYKGGGRPSPRLAASLPRTLLSQANAVENRTALLARREMQSWRLLQLEPSALREPDAFTAPDRLGSKGEHLAATLNRLARSGVKISPDSERSVDQGVYAKVANRLSTLIDDVREVHVDRDEKRELYTVIVSGRDGTSHPARALSDGTLRFLALTVLDLDPLAQGVLCLEEPENGIHPARIPAMLSLLKEIANDPQDPIGFDNPLRQVIINTHSPAVVGQVDDVDLIVAEIKETVDSGKRFGRVSFACMPGTWRAKLDTDTGEQVPITIDKGTLLTYLNPIPIIPIEVNGLTKGGSTQNDSRTSQRVVDRPDVQTLLPLFRDAK